MNTFLKLAVVSALVVGGLLLYLLAPEPQAVAPTTPLTLYCAAGMKEPVAEIAAKYEEEYGIPINIQYGGSGTLLSQIQAAPQGDLYLAADTSYTDIAREQGLIAEVIPVNYLRPVIAVQKGNPKNIESIDDLARDDVRVALGSPEAASIGKLTKEILEGTGQWTEIEAAVRDRGVFKPTVNEIANDVKIGSVDAAIVWDATVNTYGELEAIIVPQSEEFKMTSHIAVLNESKNPTAAIRFARYLSSRDKGLPVFAAMGFPPVDGDVWEETPEIIYYSGGVNRLAIQETIAAFEEREGVVIETIYNGCGILVGQMKLGERPDVYHSCDISFMRQVNEIFEPALSLTRTEMIIAVPKGNPRGITSLEDLGQEGLKIGLANEEQSALGALTARMLKEEGCYDIVVKNVVARTPTADLLVNQMRTGSLDAVVVYEANMPYALDDLEIVRLHTPSAIATQTYAVSKNSRHKYLTQRLLDTLSDASSVSQFQDVGFQWLVK